MLELAKLAGYPEAALDYRLIYPVPKTIPYPEPIMQFLTTTLQGSCYHLFSDIEKESKYPANGHGKGCSRILHSGGNFLKAAVPEGCSMYSSLTNVEKKICQGDKYTKASKEDTPRIRCPLMTDRGKP